MRTLLPLFSLGLLLLSCTTVPLPRPEQSTPEQHLRCPSPGASPSVTPVACADELPQPDSAAVSRLRRLLLRLHSQEGGFEGSFRASFVIDTSGKVIHNSVRVLEATSDRVAQRYANDLTRMLLFSPARLRGHPVAVSFTLEVQYQHPPYRWSDTLAPPLAPTVQITRGPWGGQLAFLWRAVATEPLRNPDESTIHQAQVSAIEEVLRRLPEADSLAYACVSLPSLPDGLSSTDLQHLIARRPRVVRPSDCPPTYGGMIQMVDSLGRPRVRPPGAGPDPYHIRVTRIIPWSEDWTVVWISEWKGSSGQEYRCAVYRGSDRRRSEFASWGRWIS